MTEYYIPTGHSQTELVEKRSRFIGQVWRVSSEEEARARIEETKKKHYDANLERELADRLLADGVLDIVQYPYNMVNRTKEDVLKYYASQGCGTMGYGSLGGGILTGQFREVPTFGHGDMRASFYGPMFTEPGFSQIQALLKVMDGIAEAHKATVAQVAINWSLAHDYIHTVLTGVGNAAEAEENCAAAAWELTAQEKQALDEAISKIHIYS